MDDQREKITRDLLRQLADGWNAADGAAFGASGFHVYSGLQKE